jgi:hypothetical protein
MPTSRGDVRVDIRLDAFRALFAIVQATDGGRFAPALDAVGAAHAHQHQRLHFMVATDILCGGWLARRRGWFLCSNHI